MKDKIKNVTIFILVLLTVYQVTQLWFDDPSSHNFFAYSKKSISPSSGENSLNFHTPYRIIFNDGNNNYSAFYSNILQLLNEHNFDDFIYYIDKLKYIDTYDYNLLSNLDYNRCIIYEYNFQIKTSDFLESINQKIPDLNNYVDGFDSITIYPNKTQYKPLKIIFSNSKTNLQYEFQLENSGNFTDLYNWIDNNKNITVSYDLLDDLAIFKNNIIIPYWQNNFEYNVVKVKNPYRNDNGEENISIVESEINDFFDNPSAKNAKPYKDEYYSFSDKSRKVLYYYPGESSYLEYNNYKTNKTISDTLVERFSVAVDFINSDQNIINDIYLHHYKENAKETTFYFDYSIDNFPIFLSNDFKSLTHMDHHIEIIVENSIVNHYKKIVLNYEIAGYSDYANVSYNNVLDGGFSIGSNLDGIIKNASLVYKSDISGESYIYNDINLNWIISTEDNITTYSAKELGD